MANNDVCVTFCYRNDFIRIYKSNFGALDFPEYIRLLIDRENRRFGIQPCSMMERDRIRVPKWTGIDSGGVEFHGMAFLEVLYEDVMRWDIEQTYRAYGECIEENGVRYEVFNLDDAEVISGPSYSRTTEGKPGLFEKGGKMAGCIGMVFDLPSLILGISQSCLRALESPSHIQMLVNQDTGEMIIRGATPLAKDAHRIPSKAYEKALTYGIMGDPLISMIYELLDWNKGVTYVTEGSKTPDGVLFGLKSASMIDDWDRKVITEEFGMHE